MRSWRLLDQFRRRLKPHLDAAARSPSENDPRRELFAEDYFCLTLFSLFNPCLKSMRGLCHASQRIERMREVCSRPVAAGSFSEGQHVFGPEILEGVLRDLAKEAKGRAEFGDERVRQAVKVLTLVDGTILRALPRMAWAPASGHGCALRLNLHFSVLDQVPEEWTITPGKESERRTFKRQAKPGKFYVADRLYSDDHQFLRQMQRREIDFVMRLPSDVHRKPVEAARPLTAQDRQAGVVSDRLEQLGKAEGGPIVRVVEVHAGEKVLVLITNRKDLSAELIGLIYRYRWQIELFFKWFKTILGAGHWLAESPRGAAIQIYSALIASLMLMILNDRRPTKRQMEFLHLYFVGFATEEELIRELGLQKN